MLTGIDVSHHQGRIDWPQVARAGHDFAIVKATEGIAFVDPRLSENWHGAARAGLVRGAYHFLRREQDARAQAGHFVHHVAVRSYQQGQTIAEMLRGSLLAVDVETRHLAGGRTSNPLVGQIVEFVEEVRRQTRGHPVLVYTSWAWWTTHGGNTYGPGLGPLWHARYRPLDLGPGPMYGSWRAPTFWQHTSSGRCPGVDGPVDLNRFYGDRLDLEQLAHPRTPAPIPEEDDDMKPHAVQLENGTYAYVAPDGTVIDQAPNDDDEWVPLREGSSGLGAFRAIYEGSQANRRQVDVVQRALRAARGPS